MRIEDARGDKWQVKHGDPANEYVLKLKALGFTYVVLPTALLTGDAEGGILEVEPAAHSVPRFLPPADGDPTRIVRRARLLECMMVLEQEDA